MQRYSYLETVGKCKMSPRPSIQSPSLRWIPFYRFISRFRKRSAKYFFGASITFFCALPGWQIDVLINLKMSREISRAKKIPAGKVDVCAVDHRWSPMDFTHAANFNFLSNICVFLNNLQKNNGVCPPLWCDWFGNLRKCYSADAWRKKGRKRCKRVFLNQNAAKNKQARQDDFWLKSKLLEGFCPFAVFVPCTPGKKLLSPLFLVKIRIKDDAIARFPSRKVFDRIIHLT
jgi:hypothetical protein